MSRHKGQGRGEADPTETEGWESLAEASEGTLAPSPELEEALREAAEAVEAAERPRLEAELEPEAATQVEELSARLVETEDRLLRLQADFDNFRRRALKEREESLRYGHQNLVKELLSTVDNLDRAIDHVRKSEGEDFDGLLKGVELVRKELLAALAKYEVAEIEAQGKLFSPALHEAMAKVPDSSVPPGTVLEVLQRGYQLRDRLLRPARVVVAAAGATDGEGEASD
ncbi:MAG: nucleotide exchange factor GrpE [Candidatus Rokubacteria bacterium]|nr:nucleotide exchange factor GrpE [Candidatus Rokubacteria bacterium]